MFVVMFSNISA